MNMCLYLFSSFLQVSRHLVHAGKGWAAAPLQVANHSNHTPRVALPFSSNNSFSRSRDDRGMVIAIHGDDWCKSFTWPDALPDVKPSYETGPLSDNSVCR